MGKRIERNRPETHTLLKTKMFIPLPRPGWISRLRLIEKMNEGFGRKLTLLSAPAGFGKTTLLTEWVHQKDIPSVWFSLDKSDNAPSQFLSYIIHGLRKIEENAGAGALAMLQSPQPPPIESIVINLINDVVHIPADIALILDDYHLIDNVTIHDIITFLLENMPSRMHLIIASRSDPPLLYARLRSQNQLTELRAADLGFTRDETLALFNDALDLQLSEQDIHLLETRTEGWIAGLQLAALSLRGREDASGFIKEFKGDHRYIADYLTEEVLNQQNEQVRDFLLRTSILGRMSGPLCDAVTGREDSGHVLSMLETANLFVIPLDDERIFYRYHHLFANLLEQRLRMDHGDLVPRLHDRASRWLAQNGFRNEAVDHALAAENYCRAAGLIEEIAEINWERAQDSRLMQWFGKLPDEWMNSNPILLIFHARELLKNRLLNDAENKLRHAEQLLDSEPGDARYKEALRGRMAVIRAYLAARTGDASRIIRFSNQAMEALPEKDLMWRSVTAAALGFSYGWMGIGDMKKAGHAFTEARDLCRTAGNVYYSVFAGSCLAAVLMIRGRLKEARELCMQSLHHAENNGIAQTGIVGGVYGTLGMINCEWNDLNEGIRLIEKGVELSRLSRDPVILASCRINLLRALLYRMDHKAASEMLGKLNQSTKEYMYPPWITNTIAAFNAFFLIAGGRLDAAAQWARERRLGIEDKFSSLRELEYLALAHMLIVRKQLDDADLLLNRLIENAADGDRVYSMIAIRMMRLSLFMARGDRASALDELKSALMLAEPGGFLMIFASKEKPVADLLEEIYKTQKKGRSKTTAFVSPSYIKKILMVFKTMAPPQKTEGLMDPLSDRELEVLHLIVAGLSNREIAEKLFISLNTVKTHTRNINSKLNVNNRAKAGARAKELGLL
jgi:LuxR family maltose regulon positive regulatory protein